MRVALERKKERLGWRGDILVLKPLSLPRLSLLCPSSRSTCPGKPQKDPVPPAEALRDVSRSVD